MLSNEHSPSAVEHVEENVVYMKINLCFREFRNLGNKRSVVLSNRHSRCLDCNFGTKINFGRNIVRICCPILIEKLSTEFPKLHYSSPEERFEEKVVYLRLFLGRRSFLSQSKNTQQICQTCIPGVQKNIRRKSWSLEEI